MLLLTSAQVPDDLVAILNLEKCLCYLDQAFFTITAIIKYITLLQIQICTFQL